MTSSKKIYELSPQRLYARVFTRILGDKIDEKEVEYLVGEVPRSDLGDYGIQIARFAKRIGVELEELSETVARELSREEVVADTRTIGGFLNIVLDLEKLSELVFTAARNDREEYGLVRVEKPEKIVVEHTSANPVHPLHIGHGRNASLGDTLARLLRARGHSVQTRFYINDMGRQVAVLAYGYILAGRKPPRSIKPDHWIGQVYAITHTLVDIENLKKELEKLRLEGRDEEYREKLAELDNLVANALELREKDPELFDKIANAIKNRDPEREIATIMKKYEYREDKEIIDSIREAVELCLEGFKETLSRLGIEIDVWDWESDLAWSGEVEELLHRVKSSTYRSLHKGALALNLQQLLDDKEIREKLGIRQGEEIPPLILVRSDGTTLYTTRDIVYTLKKFREYNADKVYNVIAAEQRLEQLQVRLSLIALGYRREGLNTIHYLYEMVNLPGQKMSGRRGKYISLDELIDRAVEQAKIEVEKRNPELLQEEKNKIAETIGTAAIKYTLVSVSPLKPITFNLEEALDFTKNSAPYILYTHARAANILAKYNQPIEWEKIEYTTATENPHRKKLLKQLYTYPYIFVKSADEQKPELLINHTYNIADTFNQWYTSRDHVLGEKDPGKKQYKLALVYTTKQTLANTLKILGIKPLQKM